MNVNVNIGLLLMLASIQEFRKLFDSNNLIKNGL